MKEILFSTNYNDGLCSYLVEKEINENNISIIAYDVWNGQHRETKKIQYRNIGEEFSAPFLSWYNLLFCSGGDPAPDYEYMHRAVQEGKKTAATVYLNPDSKEGKKLVSTLPEDCSSLPYAEYMIYVFHKGCLSDFFDFEKVKSLYIKHGAYSIDWDRVKEYFEKDLSFFGDEQACGFSLQSGGIKEQTIITGLILGYPVESTIAYLRI